MSLNKNTQSVEEELREIEHQWGIAVQRREIARNVETVEEILADDWRGVTATGEIRTKKDAIAQLRARDVEIESVDLHDIEVRAYGECAVVTGRELRTGTCVGRDLSGPSQWTDVFVRIAGRWQIVASQSTMVDPNPIRQDWQSAED